MMKKFMLALGLAAFALTSGVTGASAETHIVKMVNKNPDTKQRNAFIPDFLKIMPGDTVKFVSTDKGHNTQSLKKMLPEGAAKWKSKISKDFEITYDKVGIYGYKCTPHYGQGMVGMIVVDGKGWDANAEKLKKVKHRGKAKKIFKKMWEQADALMKK